MLHQKRKKNDRQKQKKVGKQRKKMIGKNKKRLESIADFPTTYAQVYIKNYFTPISNNSAAISGLTIRIRLSFSRLLDSIFMLPYQTRDWSMTA